MGTNEKRRRANIKQAILVIFVFAGLGVGINYYYKWKEEKDLITVSFRNPDNSQSMSFKLEVVSTPQERATGLMYRKSLGSNRGMLFIFPVVTLQSFWMKNTYIALDIIFIDQTFKVVGILDQVLPLSERKQSISKRSKYVVELLAGTAEKNGIRSGSRMEYEAVLPQPT